MFPENLAPSHQAPPAASRCPRPYQAPVTPDQKPVLVNQETGSPCVSQLQGSPLRLPPSAPARPAGPGCHHGPRLWAGPSEPRPPAHPRAGRLQQPRSLQAHASAGGSAHPHACRLSRSRASCMDQARPEWRASAEARLLPPPAAPAPPQLQTLSQTVPR